MSRIVVGVADMKASGDIKDILITHALGSCIGVAVYDPVVKVGGLLHFMLPDSSLDLNKAVKTPAMFADTGIPFLFKSCYRLGAEKRRMIVKIAGGSNIMDNSDCFRIGQKNIIALRKIFWKNNVLIDGEDTGGHHNRAVCLNIFSGKVVVKNSGRISREL